MLVKWFPGVGLGLGSDITITLQMTKASQMTENAVSVR